MKYFIFSLLALFVCANAYAIEVSKEPDRRFRAKYQIVEGVFVDLIYTKEDMDKIISTINKQVAESKNQDELLQNQKNLQVASEVSYQMDNIDAKVIDGELVKASDLSTEGISQ